MVIFRVIGWLLLLAGVGAFGRDLYVLFTTGENAPLLAGELWARIFRRLEDPDNLPFLFHCTAGKDRTGFVAALVLLALGVPAETVYEDYLVTNRYRAAYNTMILRWAPLYSLFRTEKQEL